MRGELESFDEDLSIYECIDSWVQPSDVVVAPLPREFLFTDDTAIADGLPPSPTDPSSIVRSETGELLPCSLPSWIVLEAATCWGTEPTELAIQREDDFGSSVGLLHGKVPVYASYLLVTRPKRVSAQQKSAVKSAPVKQRSQSAGVAKKRTRGASRS